MQWDLKDLGSKWAVVTQQRVTQPPSPSTQQSCLPFTGARAQGRSASDFARALPQGKRLMSGRQTTLHANPILFLLICSLTHSCSHPFIDSMLGAEHIQKG